jgi:transglutaminase-like putative cysteine protease
MRPVTLLTLLVVGPGLLSAQAPVITSAGDPSVADDTIYALAVDPATHPNADWVVLLDDGVIRVESGGGMRSTYRHVVQVLTPGAAEQWGEWSLTYFPGRERLLVNWVRVRRPDGTVLSEQPVHERESLAPVAESAPVYTDARVRRLSLGGVAPNTIVDLSYTVERLRPVVPDDFLVTWDINGARRVRRSRFLVDLPATLSHRVSETNLPAPRRTSSAGGRRTMVWAAAEVPAVDPELFAAVPNQVDATVRVSGAVSWPTIARWYADLAHDRYGLTDSLERHLGSLLAGAGTLDDSVRALHRWVAQDFRYVSLAFGLGGYRPRAPSAVVEAQYGDCKDKTTLFVALARFLGWEAVPVLTATNMRIDSTVASIHAFDHMIAAVRRDSGWQFTDLTADLFPFGALPPTLERRFGLLVHPDGRGEPVTLPARPREENWRRFLVTGIVDSAGGFAGRYEETGGGSQELPLRLTFADPIPPEQRDRLARAVASRVFVGATGDSLEAFPGRDLSVPARMAVRLTGARLTRGGGTSWILTLPWSSLGAAQLSHELAADSVRRYPLDVAAIFGQGAITWEFTATLPEGWQADLPGPVRAESRFGTYQSRYTQEGTRLTVLRRLEGQGIIEPPEGAAQLVTWIREIERDDVRVLILHARP